MHSEFVMSITICLKVLESEEKDSRRKKSGKRSDWTWRIYADLIKFQDESIKASLLKFDNPNLNKLAIATFEGKLICALKI